uniref:Large ribosomal subunit protein bL32c n=1 Tax=Microrhizoidea pickettheapsiorum TaxID=2604950 RepID=A0A5B9RFV0_9CHLO|nr:ribosomal protein L32 [Microrhizoidea pickettheapsiorum]QEG77721.1 ribosomal protein L32 [Microrhizoidea pickettheapsiorum]
MALPKKRTPKSRRNSRRSFWFEKALKQGKKALALSKSSNSKKSENVD